MLSAQVDKLRELATRYDKLQVGEVRAVTMPSEMGSILRDAADTIWELRCKCAGMVDMRERARVAEAENVRLRELCADLYAEMIEYSDAPHYNASVWAPKLRKLGVEVDA